MVAGAASPGSAAVIPPAWDVVEGGGAAAVAVRLDPVHLHAPRLVVVRPVAVLVRGEAAADASGGGANPGVSEAVNSDLAALAESLKDKEKPKEDDSDDDEAEIVEESPCGRWLKRREEVIF